MSADLQENRKVGDLVVWENHWRFKKSLAKYGDGPFTIAKIKKTPHVSGAILTYYFLEEVPDSEWDHSFFTDPTEFDFPPIVVREPFTMTCTNPKCKKVHHLTEHKDCCGSCYWDLE